MPASVDAEDGTVRRRAEAESVHHRDHGPGRLLPRRAPAREGLRGLRDDPPLELVQHGADRPHLRDRTSSSSPPLRRPHRRARRSTSSMRTIRPDEVYNLGAQSHVRVSFDIPEYTADVTGARARCGCSTRSARADVKCRFYQAGSSEMFGKVAETPQTRDDAVPSAQPVRRRRRSSAYWITRNYREAYGMFAVNGILFNHESPRRGETFVTRKITRAVGAHPARRAGGALPRQPRREARLGFRARLRRGRCG